MVRAHVIKSYSIEASNSDSEVEQDISESTLCE